MDINLLNIRSIGGSQQLGFEELCCQLARHEVLEEASQPHKVHNLHANRQTGSEDSECEMVHGQMG